MKRQEFSYDEFMGMVEEVGECLEWTGAYRVQATPLPLWNSTSVRLIVWRMTRGAEIRPGCRLSVSCRNPRCVHPDHLKQRPRSEELAGTKRSAAFKAKIAATKRAQMAVDGMCMELACEIRNSPERAVDIAQRLNRSQFWVGMVRNNRRWAEYITPFAGLGARS